MNIFEDSINLLKGAAFTNIEVKETYIFLESPAIFNEYIVPLTFLDKFDTQSAHDLFTLEQGKDKNISYYLRQTLLSDYEAYLSNLKVSLDYIDSYMVLESESEIVITENNAKIVEVSTENYNDYKTSAMEIFGSWANQEDYIEYFRNLAAENKSNKVFKDFILELDGVVISVASAIFDVEMNLLYIHNTGTVEAYRRNGYFSILNKLLINKAHELGITRIYSIVEKNSDSYNAYKKIGFKEADSYYSFS